MKVLRVFPGKRNQYTPTDELTHCANYKLQVPFAEMFPAFDEVHISCCFTWDKLFCENLKKTFSIYKKPVRLGGVAYSSQATDFTQGMYLKNNIIFTSRGCNNNCSWCIVPKIEGKLKELNNICIGNVIQDNNFLQTNKSHKEKVFEMLKTQKGICFKGGLQSDLVDSHFINNISSLRISELWLACDTDGHLKTFKKTCEKLIKAGFNRNKIRCYVLIGDDMCKNEIRLREIYNAGAMPFAQLKREYENKKTEYSKEWNKFARMWSRPAAIIAHMEKGTKFEDFNT